ncbi:hypothetical protein [Gillisia sp. CAL575]|uniref:hypothetical protein n=1 Tax=Gillisia sp. CAL575 TaxID=985255 RepID=UPI00039C4762|nr:hypothetical protein [Gillisia sp. CAL575]
MKLNRINLQILDKISIKKLFFQEAPAPLFLKGFSKENNSLLQTKNVVLSGEFFPINYKDNLNKWEANLQPEITPETEYLLCGKYPDWVLVEEARHYGIKVIFTDKAGELFSRIATKLINSKTALTIEEPLGV